MKNLLILLLVQITLVSRFQLIAQNEFPCGTHIDWDWTDPT